MATLSRVRVSWEGAPVVGGGLSTFYSTNLTPTTFVGAVRTFFSNIAFLFPDDVSIQVAGDGDTFTDTTGALVGSWSMTPPAVVLGLDTGTYAKGVGIRTVWNTLGIRNGRRVRGSTFLVPIGSANYDSAGSIASAVLTMVQSAADALEASDSGSMRIWSRPSDSSSTDGASHAITSASVPDAVTWLRSRRT